MNSGSDDDWENAVEDQIQENEEKKTDKKFADEDAVDSDEEREKKKAAQAKHDAENPKQVKVKSKKLDVDEMWEQKMKAKGGAKPVAAATAPGAKPLKGEALSKQAEADIVDDLFAADIGTESSGLRTEKNYVEFAKQVSEILFKGQTPYNIPAFFKELMRDLSKDQLTSDEVKKILDACSVCYNSKVAEEKKL